MFDGGVIVAYLAAHAMKGAHKLADAAIDGLLNRLADAVRKRLGPGPEDDLRAEPQDPKRRDHVRGALEQAGRRDPEFATVLADLQDALDHHNGRELLNQLSAPGGSITQFIGGGVSTHGSTGAGSVNVGGGLGSGAVINTGVYAPYHDPSDMSGAPLWIKVTMGIGSVLCVAGLGLFFLVLFGDHPDPGEPGFGDMPAGIPRAFGVFFAGFVLIGFAGYGNSVRKKQR